MIGQGEGHEKTLAIKASGPLIIQIILLVIFAFLRLPSEGCFGRRIGFIFFLLLAVTLSCLIYFIIEATKPKIMIEHNDDFLYLHYWTRNLFLWKGVDPCRYG